MYNLQKKKKSLKKLTYWIFWFHNDSTCNSHWCSQTSGKKPYSSNYNFGGQFTWSRTSLKSNVNRMNFNSIEIYEFGVNIQIDNFLFGKLITYLRGLKIARCRSIAIAVNVKTETLTESTCTKGQNAHMK